MKIYPHRRLIRLGPVLLVAHVSLWAPMSPVSNAAGGSRGESQRASADNGFDLSNALIPKSEILSGGPPRDGIPSIDRPVFIKPEAASYLKDGDIVISVTIGGTTRAYPLRILVWHEIVNDRIEGHPIAVTYCPLCGTAMVFDRRRKGRTLTFGVSGLLYQSDVLMYDRETESLWSQLAMKSVSGKLVGETLVWMPSDHMTWREWKRRRPNGTVLSRDTGHRRDYDTLPYRGYERTEKTYFPVPKHRVDYPNKTWVLGVVIDGASKAYPVPTLPNNRPIFDSVNGKDIVVRYDAAARRPSALDAATARPIPSVMAYFFAWQAFYPNTELWDPREKQPPPKKLPGK